MRKRVASGLEVLPAILIGAALLRAIAGPLRFDVLGASLSVRTLSRPLVLAALMLAARIWLDSAPRRMATATVMVSRVLLGAVIAAGILGWVTYLSTTCGGADSYGYVSAADRLLAGKIVQMEPVAHLLPFADAISAATPLGYTPSPRIAGASVPVYPLGLPAVMAVARATVGPLGPFVVAPVMGILLLACVYVAAYFAARDRLRALIATALTAVHPLVVTYSIQPMSDVPAAALFLMAAAALLRRPARPTIAGVAAAMCLLIRPALTPALAALVCIPMIVERRIDIRSGVKYAVPVACGLTLQLGLQWYLYGHPLANGYADVGTLFSIDRIGTNARSHGYWAWLSLGPVFLATAMVGFILLQPAIRWALAIVITTITMPYLAYRTFDHWETLRFLLPGLVILTIPAAGGLLGVTRRVAGAAGGALLSALLVLLLAHSWTTWLRANNVFTMPDHETRYKLAGELVADTTPPNAVVLAQQHSGSVRYYANRSSVNWDRIPAGAMAATIAALNDAGYSVFLLIDSNEERVLFERKHGATAGWLPAGQRRNVQLFEARRTRPVAGR